MTGYYVCVRETRDPDMIAHLLGPFLERPDDEMRDRGAFALCHNNPMCLFPDFYSIGVSTITTDHKFPVGQANWMFDWIVIDPSFPLETPDA